MEIKSLDSGNLDAKSLYPPRPVALSSAQPSLGTYPTASPLNSAQVTLSDASQRLLETERPAARAAIQAGDAALSLPPERLAPLLLNSLKKEVVALKQLAAVYRAEARFLNLSAEYLNLYNSGEPAGLQQFTEVHKKLEMAQREEGNVRQQLHHLEAEHNAILDLMGLPKGDYGIWLAGRQDVSTQLGFETTWQELQYRRKEVQVAWRQVRIAEEREWSAKTEKSYPIGS
jgi:hypothetical protein